MALLSRTLLLVSKSGMTFFIHEKINKKYRFILSLSLYLIKINYRETLSFLHEKKPTVEVCSMYFLR